MRKEKILWKVIFVTIVLLILSLVAFLIVFIASLENEQPKSNFPEIKSSKVEYVQAKKTNYTEEDVALLARLIHGEARGEPYKGQVAVGAVVLNRMKSKSFPSTMEEVIFQKNQFSCVNDGQFYIDIPKDSSVYKAAREALEGNDPSNGCVYFYNPEISTSRWIFENTKTVITIGSHRFAVDK